MVSGGDGVCLGLWIVSGGFLGFGKGVLGGGGLPTSLFMRNGATGLLTFFFEKSSFSMSSIFSSRL